jgi:hypothetical protein
MEKEFLKILQKRVAEGAIGASTLRNMGAPEMVKIARNFLSKLNLKKFLVNESKFEKQLNDETERLRKKFPRKGQHWGAARKAINIFLRDVLYNKFLCDRLKFNRIEHYLEIPIDRYTANGIREDSKKGFQRWNGVIHLTEEMNKKYQEAASDIAKNKYNKYKIERVHLDSMYWRKRKKE